jgi:4-amino-4-deoxy-L-arabinose transferase-like glycosyltransferase
MTPNGTVAEGAARTCPGGEPAGRAPLWGLGAGIFAYLASIALIQYLLSSTAELDQAEQVLLSQEFAWGYTAQPPLYTWIVALVFSATGPSFGALLAVKVVVLGLLAAALLATGRAWGFSWAQQVVAVVGLGLIPQVIWESQRDLTHSPLAAMFAAAALFQVARLRRSPRPHNYLLLGLVVGLGVLSKYNYALFLAGLLSAVALTPSYRKAIVRLPLAWSVVVAAAIVAPHVAWAVGHLERVAAGLGKLDRAAGWSIEGLGHMAGAALAFSAPVGLLAVLVVRRHPRLPEAQADHRRLLSRLLAAVVVVAAVFVLASGAKEMKDRWFQPLLFFLPLLVSLCSAPSPRAVRRVAALGIAVGVLVSLLLPARLLLVGYTGRLKRPHTPYEGLAADLRQAVGRPDVIVAEDRFIGGNMRLQFPGATVLTPDTPVPAHLPGGRWLVLCADCRNKRFHAWMSSRLNLDPQGLRFDALTRPYYYTSAWRYALWYASMDIRCGQEGT